MVTRIVVGDCRHLLPQLEAGSVHCCVTSPPYFGLRDYSVEGQIGLESSLDAYITTLVEVFREVRRVLRDDGTLWLNLGDSYAGGAGGRGDSGRQFHTNGDGGPASQKHDGTRIARDSAGLKPKDLMMVPARVALALQADGWYLRSDIIWHKPNPMPESVTDRPTSSHEHVFLLTKRSKYFYDAEAVKEGGITNDNRRPYTSNGAWHLDGRPVEQQHGGEQRTNGDASSRNLRNVWTIATQPYPDAHFATFPPALVEPCIKGGTSERGCCAVCGAPWVRVVERGESDYARMKREHAIDWRDMRGVAKGEGKGHDSNRAHIGGTRDANGKAFTYRSSVVGTTGWHPSCRCDAGEPIPCTVLDPFAGAGTTGLVAERLGRDSILIELNPSYAAMSHDRIRNDAPLFTDVLM